MSCKVKTNNTAESRCKLELGLYRRVILVPISARFTGLNHENEQQSIEEWLEQGIHAEKPEDRFYPMPLFTDCEDNSEDNTEWTNGYGTSYVVREGAFGFTQSFERDVCLNRRLLDFNGQQFRALIIDNQNNIQGVRFSEGFTGELCNIWVSQPKANSASELSEPKIKYSFPNPNEHKLRDIVQSDLSYGDMNGLEEVTIQFVAAKTFKIVLADCGNTDVTNEFSILGGKANGWLISGARPTAENAPTYNATTNLFSLNIQTSEQTQTIKVGTPQSMYDLGVANKVMDEEVVIVNS